MIAFDTKNTLNVGIMVAHPDDETLWMGGTLLMNPQWHCRICTLCRASDHDRAPKFQSVLEHYGASGVMTDMDDGPDQSPLTDSSVQDTVAELFGNEHYDLFITHSPMGEYTSHRRHQEANRAVVSLWQTGILKADRLWLFAYNDHNETHLPRAIDDADIQIALPPEIWEEKHRIICERYGFTSDSWEARSTPRIEAFWTVDMPGELSQKFRKQVEK